MSKKTTLEETNKRLEPKNIFIENYTNINTPVIAHCKICGHVWQTRPSVLLNLPCGCPNCLKRRKLTQEEFVALVNERHPGDEFEVLSEYRSMSEKVKIRHKKCGLEFETRAGNFVRSGKYEACGCPKCAASKGEAKVRKFLTSQKIIFKEQVRFEDCKDKRFLPFDFGVYSESGELEYLIEYDGLQHYEERKSSTRFSKERVELVRKHDKMKNKYCEEHNITLIRIIYPEDPVKKLTEFIKNRSTTIENTSAKN